MEAPYRPWPISLSTMFFREIEFFSVAFGVSSRSLRQAIHSVAASVLGQHVDATGIPSPSGEYSIKNFCTGFFTTPYTLYC